MDVGSEMQINSKLITLSFLVKQIFFPAFIHFPAVILLSPPGFCVVIRKDLCAICISYSVLIVFLFTKQEAPGYLHRADLPFCSVNAIHYFHHFVPLLQYLTGLICDQEPWAFYKFCLRSCIGAKLSR